ncbi:MAG: hypothetical protein JKY12_04515, partial [Sneathiella sp.]|nr:hypothetical protein [Sneathiella sp.]
YPLTLEHHKHFNTINSSSVPIACGEKERVGQDNNCVDPALNVRATRELIEKSETLISLFTHVDWSALDAFQIWELLDQSVKEIFSCATKWAQAWDRAKNRFGCQAIELLVVSLEDPKIKDGANCLRFIAFKWQGEINLNFKRLGELRQTRELNQEKVTLATELRQRMPILKNGSLLDDAINSWFCKSVVNDGPDLITICVENEFVRCRITADYLSIIQNGCPKEIRVNVVSTGKENPTL